MLFQCIQYGGTITVLIATIKSKIDLFLLRSSHIIGIVLF